MTTRYVLGVDGGSTRTIAVLANDRGEVLARREGAASNYQLLGKLRLQAELGEFLRELLRDAQVPEAKVAVLFLGLSGVGRPEDRAGAEEALAKVNLAERVKADSDAAIAMTAAFGHEPGIILIAGTGSICLGRDGNGTWIRSGGWGHLLDDAGSGYFIGQQALVAALRYHDGRGERTVLRERLEKTLGLSDIGGLVPLLYQGKLDKFRIAALAPLVFQAARDHDGLANEILFHAGRELGLLISAVAQRLTHVRSPIRVALLGGVFREKDMLMPGMDSVLRRAPRPVEISMPRFEPAIGAVILALEELGVALSAEILENLGRTVEGTHELKAGSG